MSGTSARLKLLAALAAMVMVVTACGSDPENDGGDNGTDAQPEGGGTELLVEAHDFRFEVQGALPEPGEDVTVRLVNQGEAPHTFSSEDVDLNVEADPGGEGEGTFTVPDGGTVAFQCDIHPDQMTISLTSGESASSDTGSGDGESEGESTADDDYDY
jgi:plastocyanin